MSESTPDTQNQNTEPDSGAGGDGSAATGEVTDDMLPEDLQPTDDNPLAQPLDEDDDDEDSGMSLGPDGPQA